MTGFVSVAADNRSAGLAGCRTAAVLVDAESRLLDLSPPTEALLAATDPALAAERITAAAAMLSAADAPPAATVTLPGAEADSTLTLELTVLPYGQPGLRLVTLRDVSLEHNLRQALADSRQRFKDLVEASSDFAWEVGPDGAFAMVSTGGVLGYEPDDLVGRQARVLVLDPPDDGPLLPFETREPIEGYEFWVSDTAGTPACLIAAAVPLFDAAGAWCGARGVCQDVTEARHRDEELAAARNRERLMAYVVRAIGDEVDPAETLTTAAASTARALDAAGALVCRADGRMVEAARSGDLPADPPAEFGDGQSAIDIETGDGSWITVATRLRGAVNGTICLWRPSGAEPWRPEDRSLLADLAGHVAVVIEQAAQHAELERLSSTDTLTGLDNRRAFFAALEHRLVAPGPAKRAADRRPGALVYVDLDNFKQVNDALGHQEGDTALQEVARILGSGSRRGDRVARLGGDEFAIWLEDTDAAGAERKAESLLTASSALIRFTPPGGKPLGFSIGIALYDPAGGESLADLVARADEVMYQVKHHGKGGFRIAQAGQGGGA
ncbi:MAG: diguanylate cyclase [Alphaproteobacteria bacterium]|nr:diguanylate cyclase [Alphaproteobacteria bacterium]